MPAFIEIVKHVATLGGQSKRGYTKQLNWTVVRDWDSVQLDIRV